MHITSLPSSAGRAPSLSSNDSQNQSKTHLGSSVQSGVPPRAAEAKQSALELFEKTLAKGYEKLGLRMDKAGTAYPQFEPLTAEKVADNILGFISRRLQMDVAEGATQEQLQSRLEAGLAGFKKGFAEASEQLKALSMLSPAIEQDIGKTYELVTTGIDKLREQFISGIQEPAARPKSETAALTQKASTSLFNNSYEYASANSFSFELMTAEGDHVTISASSSRAYAADYTHNPGYTSFEASTGNSSSMSWVVQGDLNEQELGAINELLGRVNQLAGEFFSGNLDTAFEQALALGYDQEQITAFSLSLTQVEVQRVSTAYQTFADQPVDGINLAEQLLPLGQFIKRMLESIEDLQRFPQPEKLLIDVAEKMVAPDEHLKEQPAVRFREFLERMLANSKPE
jgi:hypothetical protein